MALRCYHKKLTKLKQCATILETVFAPSGLCYSKSVFSQPVKNHGIIGYIRNLTKDRLALLLATPVFFINIMSLSCCELLKQELKFIYIDRFS